MPLTELSCGATPVSDLSPLKGMSLKKLQCNESPVNDLSPLKGMPLTELDCFRNQVSDLSPLSGMPLTKFYCLWTPVTDLSPLQGLNLTDIWMSPKNVTNGIEVLRQMKSLKTIAVGLGPNTSLTPDEFWKKYDAGEFGKPAASSKLLMHAPGFQRWLKDVEAMPAEKQLEAVSKKLMELNEGFDGKLTDWYHRHDVPQITNGVVTSIGFSTDHIHDISPIRALPRLWGLGCVGSKLSDLTPLTGMPITHLICNGNPITDFSPLKNLPLKYVGLACPELADLAVLKGLKLQSLQLDGSKVKDLSVLKGMPLRELTFPGTQVADLSPLEGLPLTNLACSLTPVSDLSPLAGMQLTGLGCEDTSVTDLSALQGMKLGHLTFTPKSITKGIEVVRQMDTITLIGPSWGSMSAPGEFWKKFDAGEFGK